MERTVASRDLKTRLGMYLRLVREGTTFVVTDRGRPVAELRPVSVRKQDTATRLREMAAAGRITLPKDDLAPFKPLPLRGRPASETVSEDREDRL